MIGPAIKSMRVHQWVKNSFVLAPLVFARELDEPNARLHAGLAFLAFSLAASCVYLVNDVLDAPSDRAHPVKRARPIASGALPVPAALTLAAALLAGSYVAGWFAAPAVVAVTTAYLAQNVAYSLWLKRLPWLDVATIAVGFLLRLVAGAVAISVPLSPWIMACTFLLALYLGLGKRRHELIADGQGGTRGRAVLGAYHPERLRVVMLVVALLTAIGYTQYTLAPGTVAAMGTRWLVLTIPFMLAGLWRFEALSRDTNRASSPTEAILTDAPFLLNLALWTALVTALIYRPWQA